MPGSAYLLNEDTPIPAMGLYSEAVESLAAANAAALEESLPGGAEVKVLSERRTEASAADKAWQSAFSERVAARHRRDGSDEAARGSYRRLLKLVQRVKRNTSGTAELASVLQGHLAPSALTPSALVAAMERLAQGLARYPAPFVSFGVNAASLAKFEALRQALAQDIAGLIAANGALSQASALRKEKRLALLAQLRLVEGCLLIDLPADARAALTDARLRRLPRYSAPEPETVEDEEDVVPVADDDDEGGGGDEPLPGDG